MEECLGDLLYRSVLLWLDDILGYAKSDQELLQSLEAVFVKLREYNIKLNALRCCCF